jgi:hypothetical protein
MMKSAQMARVRIVYLLATMNVHGCLTLFRHAILILAV